MTDERITYPLFGQSKVQTFNGKESAWQETVEITPFVKGEDGSFHGQIIYGLIDLKTKEKIEKLEIRDIVFIPGSDTK